MYLAIARLNHSCQPNVQQTHLPDTLEEVLYACRDISIGDEINDCYIELRKSREDRRNELNKLFRFECACKSCNMLDQDIQKEDQRRMQTYKLEELVFQFAEIDPYRSLEFLEQKLQLILQEINLVWSVRYIPGTFFLGYQIATEIDKKKKAKRYLKEAYSYYIMLQGPASPEALRTKELLCTR
jgi:hypothetical protein